jgi:phosphoglycerate dehydrogenase-like enzyme
VHVTHPEVPGWAFSERHAQRLAQALPGMTCHLCTDRESFHALLPEAQVAFVWSFHQDEFALAPRLRVLATPAAGRDYFRVSPPEGVTLLYGRFHGRIMGETALGMLLGMSRGLLPAVTTYAADPWPRVRLAQSLRPLRGTHAVILGFGHIGRWIGDMLRPFAVRITGVRRREPSAERLPGFGPEDRVVSVSRLDSILPQADHLVLTLPADASTDSLLDARRLALLPAHATLINLGRGNALDETALIAALRNGRLAGACLDVFAREPLPASSPLRSCPNLWLFPHSSAISPDYLDLFVDDFADQFRAWLRQSG